MQKERMEQQGLLMGCVGGIGAFAGVVFWLLSAADESGKKRARERRRQGMLGE